MENFLLALNAVVPFIIYMAVGYAFRVFKLASEDLLNKLNSMVFKCFFPVLMFRNFCTMDLKQSFDLRMLIFAFAGVFAIILFSSVAVRYAVKEPGRRGAIVQGLFRSNSLLFALPLAQSVLGPEGYMIASVTVAIMVPVYNMLAVIILTYYGGGKTSPLKLVKAVLTNPIIIGAIAGVLVLLTGIGLPECVMKPVKAIADMTTPLSLIVLGGTLHFSAVRRNVLPLSMIVLFKLILVPALFLVIAGLVGLTPDEKFVMISVFATPVAVSSFPMAANMNCDGELAGQIVCFTTVAALFTLFLWILFFKSAGIL